MDATLGQAAKPSEVVGSKSVRKSGGLSAVTGVANVEIMKMAAFSTVYIRQSGTFSGIIFQFDWRS